MPVSTPRSFFFSSRSRGRSPLRASAARPPSSTSGATRPSTRLLNHRSSRSIAGGAPYRSTALRGIVWSAYEKISRAFLGAEPAGGLTRDRILDNTTLYWLTRTGTSAARMYWESQRAAAAAAKQTPPAVSLPVAFTVFPGEIFRAPRSWAETVYPNLIYFNAVDKGGHFAACEEPELFADEMRAAFKSLR